MEEDNVQRAYFRVRPLLTAEGPVDKADIDALLDDGYLRVVPDKNEQHTFKDRMRELSPLCVLDLVHLPADAVKVRSNKNYSPQRGENNQFIVYSDAVQPIPQQLFFEVVSAEPGEKEKIAQACTPLCYVRSGGKIRGPVSRATGLDQEGAAPLAPDSEGIFAVTLPDGTDRLFYWPRQAEAAAPAEESAPADKEEARKLNGMPLYQTQARRQQSQQRAHNALIDVVGRQMHDSRLEAPGAVLNAGAEAKPVENPMDTFKRALNTLWPMPELQQQAAAHFLSMTGVGKILDKQLSGRGLDAVAGAMNTQIQDLEAERLALIMQVDSAKKDMNALRQECATRAAQEGEGALESLKRAAEKARADLEKVNAERAALLGERDTVLADLAKEPHTVRVQAEIGGHVDFETLCERVQEAMKSAGIDCGRNDGVHLLTLLCLADTQLQLKATTQADSLAAAQALARALGVQAAEQHEGETVKVAGGGDSFSLLISTDSTWYEEKRYLRLLVDVYDEWENRAYAIRPWPVVFLKASRAWQAPRAEIYPPVQADAVREMVLRDAATPPQESLTLFDEMDRALREAGAPLPGCVRRQIYTYLSVTASRMEGGIAAAMDWAASAWIVPHVFRCGLTCGELNQLAQALPRTLALLRKEKA